MRSIFSAALLVLTLCTASCVAPVPRPQLSALEIRESQTRRYETRDTRMVMKALLNVLQDEGFMTKNAVSDLGLITAVKETDMQSNMDIFSQAIIYGRDARWPKNSILEATANVTERDRETMVRVNFQRKVLDNFGATMSIDQIQDPRFYQDFFFKVDKGIFLQKERI